MTFYENGYVLLCNHSLLGFFLIGLHDLDEHQFLDPCKTIGNSTYWVTMSFNRVPCSCLHYAVYRKLANHNSSGADGANEKPLAILLAFEYDRFRG